MPSLAEIHRSLSISPRPSRQEIVTSENFTSEANEFGLYNSVSPRETNLKRVKITSPVTLIYQTDLANGQSQRGERGLD